MDTNMSLHAYIKEELLDRIRTNKYEKGEQIPTELELCNEFNVSRTTVRTALNQLKLEGYLVRHQGKGTYVADEKVSQTLSHTIKRYKDQMAVQGKVAEISLLHISVIPANELLRDKLKVEMDAPIQKIERIRKINDEPTLFEIAYIPWNVAPGITKEHAETSLYAALKDVFQVNIAKTIESIEITLADERTCQYLNCEPDLPCFYIDTLAENENGQIVEYSRSYFRGDKTNFVIERSYPLD